MLIRKITICVGIIFSLVLFVSYLGARTWTSKMGEHKIEAEYVRVEGDSVLLRKQDGSLVKPKIELLSTADQDYIKNKQKSAEQDIFAAVPEEKPVEKTTTTKQPENKPKEKQPENSLKAKDGSRVVTVEGIGSTFEEAKKDAFRNAVSKVVGTLVDTQTRVTKEGVIEQMLTASNAYVDEHKILSRNQKDGLWEITMEAAVESRAVQMRLTPSKEEVIAIDGSSIAGKIQTKDESENDAVLLLVKALKDNNYPYSILEVSGVMEKEPVKKEGDSVTMRVNVTVKANAEKFEEFRKKMEPILDKIALSKNNMTLKMNKNGDSYRLDSLPRGNNDKSMFLHFNTSRNNNLTNTGWKSYEFPGKVFPILFFRQISFGVPFVEIELCNTAGNAIVTDSFPTVHTSNNMEEGRLLFFPNIATRELRELLPFDIGVKNLDQFSVLNEEDVKVDEFVRELKKPGSKLPFPVKGGGGFLFSPFFMVGNNNDIFISECKVSRKLTMETSELSSIKSLKCRIVPFAPLNRLINEFDKELPEILKNWKEVKE